jgi:hypothetical protein
MMPGPIRKGFPLFVASTWKLRRYLKVSNVPCSFMKSESAVSCSWTLGEIVYVLALDVIQRIFVLDGEAHDDTLDIRGLLIGGHNNCSAVTQSCFCCCRGPPPHKSAAAFSHSPTGPCLSSRSPIKLWVSSCASPSMHKDDCWKTIYV